MVHSLLKLPFELTFRITLSHVWLFHILRIPVPFIMKTVFLRLLHLFFGAGFAGRRTGAMVCFGDIAGLWYDSAADIVPDWLLLSLRPISLDINGPESVLITDLLPQLLVGLEFVVFIERDPMHLIAVRSSFGEVLLFLGLGFINFKLVLRFLLVSDSFRGSILNTRGSADILCKFIWICVDLIVI